MTHDPHPERAPAVQFASVSLSLGERETRVDILREIDFHIRPGESVAIVGPSGSGKTSLLALLAGLERPTGGRVTVAGSELDAMNEDALAKFRGAHIGIVFQNFHLIPTMTAWENVAIPLELAGAAAAREVARARLAEVGLAERLSHYPAQLSGGEQQRVAIARALVRDPAILVADEPTGNLDEGTGAKIIDLIFSLRGGDAARTLILVTHDPVLAKRCDRVLRLRAGRIEESVSPRAVRLA